MARSGSKPSQKRRRSQPREAAREISGGSKHTDAGDSHSLSSARRARLSRLPSRAPVDERTGNRLHCLRASRACARVEARRGPALQLVQQPPRRGRRRVLGGVKRDDATVSMRSPSAALARSGQLKAPVRPAGEARFTGRRAERSASNKDGQRSEAAGAASPPLGRIKNPLRLCVSDARL